jgi:hypothetical protein
VSGNSLGLEDLLHNIEGMVSRSIVDASDHEVREIVKASDTGDHEEKGSRVSLILGTVRWQSGNLFPLEAMRGRMGQSLTMQASLTLVRI